MSEILAPDLDALQWAAEDVIEWLRGDAQDLFSIGEFWAPYPTEVCIGRLRAAAEVIADALNEGRTHPECPPLDAAIMAEVWRLLDEEQAAEKAREAAWRASWQDAPRREAEAREEAARKEARRQRDARRADVYRRLLHPDSGASASERAQAAAHLERLQ